jgi:UTP:GlnB (protein PII) uridylyltransferase
MATLIIDLQDGFSADTIIIHVNGDSVYHKQNIETDLRISRADSTQTQVHAGSVNLDINVPTKRLSKAVTLQVATTLYVGISIRGDTLEVRSSDKPFLYM